HSGQGIYYPVQEPPPLVVTKAGKVRFGPVGEGTRTLQVFVPSRTRAGAGTTLQLGELSPDQPSTIDMPELDRQLVRGRAVLAEPRASERMGVVARAGRTRPETLFSSDQPNVAGLDGDGNFVLDLPAGSYRLLLFDLETGIAFHGEGLKVTQGMAPLLVRPE